MVIDKSRSKHDLFFSKSLEHPSIAKDFMKQHIPRYLQKHLIWKNLYRIDRTNTDAILKRLHQDAIYKVATDQDIEVIVGV
jgi:hypothetical protein